LILRNRGWKICITIQDFVGTRRVRSSIIFQDEALEIAGYQIRPGPPPAMTACGYLLQARDYRVKVSHNAGSII